MESDDQDGRDTELRLKSEGERQIARLLKRNKIDYRYEQPIAVIDDGNVKLWYPDFWLSRYGLFIEYWGIKGDTDYMNRCRHKREVYKKNGIEGLFFTEASFKGNWPDQMIGQIEGILKDRLDRFYGR